jgi:hypothetical protein
LPEINKNIPAVDKEYPCENCKHLERGETSTPEGIIEGTEVCGKYREAIEFNEYPCYGEE